MFAKLWNLLRYQRLDREQRGLPPLETLTRDVRLSIRSMRRTPSLTLAVLGTLAIGIGANTAIFTVINGVLIKPLPYPDADRLVSISLASHVMRIADLESAPYVYLTQRDQSRTLERVGLWNLQAVNVSGREAPERAMTLRVTADILPALGIDPLFGRYFTPADDEPRDAFGTFDRFRRGANPAATVGGPRCVGCEELE